MFFDAGAIPYYSGLETLDFGGLNDEFLSRRWIERMPDAKVADYFYAADCGAVVVTSRDWERVKAEGVAGIFDDPRFDRYTLVRRYRSAAVQDYFELVFLRRDLAGAPAAARTGESPGGNSATFP